MKRNSVDHPARICRICKKEIHDGGTSVCLTCMISRLRRVPLFSYFLALDSGGFLLVKQPTASARWN